MKHLKKRKIIISFFNSSFQILFYERRQVYTAGCERSTVQSSGTVGFIHTREIVFGTVQSPGTAVSFHPLPAVAIRISII